MCWCDAGVKCDVISVMNRNLPFLLMNTPLVSTFNENAALKSQVWGSLTLAGTGMQEWTRTGCGLGGRSGHHCQRRIMRCGK